MWKRILAFHRDESGDLMQTAIIMAIMAVVAVVAYTTVLGPKIRNLFNKTGQQLDAANGYQ